MKQLLCRALPITLPPLLVFAMACAQAQSTPSPETDGPVGLRADGLIELPTHQFLQPAGHQVELNDWYPQSVAVHPRLPLGFVAGSQSKLVVVDLITATIKQQVPLPNAGSKEPVAPQNDKELQLAFDTNTRQGFGGLVTSADGKAVYMATKGGDIKVFAVAANGATTPGYSIALPPHPNGESAAGLAISGDGTRLYVCLNISNQLQEVELPTGKLLRHWQTGIAPVAVAIAKNKAFVANWAGDTPKAGESTQTIGRGAVAAVDPATDRPLRGTLSVIDLTKDDAGSSLEVGLSPVALAVSPDGERLAVACPASDMVLLLDTSKGQLVEKISAKIGGPGDLWGAQPNALAFSPDGKILCVANGTQNAIAVVTLAAKDGDSSRLEGLIPVGWYPGSIAFDSHGGLFVANRKGYGAGFHREPTGQPTYNSHHPFGTLTVLGAMPTEAGLRQHTRNVWAANHRERLQAALLPPRPDTRPVPVPQRSGEPSTIHHVIYVMKENRCYDQVLGDLPQGLGRPDLTIFGRKITPNQHALAEQFVLLDHAYCSGVISMDGHHWAMAGIANDYVERTLAAGSGLRTYPALNVPDALSYSSGGYLWDAVVAAGKSVRIYGVAAKSSYAWTDGKTGHPKWNDFLADAKRPAGLRLITGTDAPAQPHTAAYTANCGFGCNLGVPDTWRINHFLEDLQQWQSSGKMPELTLMLLGTDHTSGTKPGSPVPAAQVADNDLAFGRLVEGVSHSPFWKDTVIIAMEDDPQAGWDHVSAYRTTLYLAGSQVRRNAVIHDAFNQVSVVRSIELILGLKPLNALTASAIPLRSCFTATPDVRPFTALIPEQELARMNRAKQAITHPVLRHYAEASDKLDFSEPDRCPEDLLNHILWADAKGPDAPYPIWATAMSSAGGEDDD
ncbi:MAG: bifunctional YncE family protein/alkaline phosphatase family protein [Verrucomicrobiota bacterium]